MDPVTIRLLALNRVAAAVVILLLKLQLNQLLHRIPVMVVMEVMVSTKLLTSQRPAHQQRLLISLLLLLRLPPLLQAIAMPMVPLVTARPPLHQLTKAINTTSSSSTVSHSSNSISPDLSSIPLSNTVGMVKDQVMAAVGIAAATEH